MQSSHKYIKECKVPSKSSLVIILVHSSTGVSGLWTSGTLCHDDLVNPKDGTGGIDCIFESPLLGNKQVKHLRLQAILDLPSIALNVETHVGFSLAVRCIQLGDHLLRLHSGVLREYSGDNLQGFSKLVDAVLLQTSMSLTPGTHLSCKLNLSTPPSGSQPAILANPLEHIHTIVNCALDVVHVVVCGTPDHYPM